MLDSNHSCFIGSLFEAVLTPFSTSGLFPRDTWALKHVSAILGPIRQLVASSPFRDLTSAFPVPLRWPLRVSGILATRGPMRTARQEACPDWWRPLLSLSTPSVCDRWRAALRRCAAHALNSCAARALHATEYEPRGKC